GRITSPYPIWQMTVPLWSNRASVPEALIWLRANPIRSACGQRNSGAPHLCCNAKDRKQQHRKRYADRQRCDWYRLVRFAGFADGTGGAAITEKASNPYLDWMPFLQLPNLRRKEWRFLRPDVVLLQ